MTTGVTWLRIIQPALLPASAEALVKSCITLHTIAYTTPYFTPLSLISPLKKASSSGLTSPYYTVYQDDKQHHNWTASLVLLHSKLGQFSQIKFIFNCISRGCQDTEQNEARTAKQNNERKGNTS